MLTGVKLVHVPCRANFMPDLLSGQVQVAFTGIASLVGYIRTGKLTALGVTTKERSARQQDIPAIAEFVAGYEASGWLGVGAPKHTPNEIVEKLNNNINSVISDPGVKSKFSSLDVEPKAITPNEFRRFFTDEIDKWARGIKFADIKPA